MRLDSNIASTVASDLLRQSDFGSAQSLPATASQAHSHIPGSSGTNGSTEAQERY